MINRKRHRHPVSINSPQKVLAKYLCCSSSSLSVCLSVCQSCLSSVGVSVLSVGVSVCVVCLSVLFCLCCPSIKVPSKLASSLSGVHTITTHTHPYLDKVLSILGFCSVVLNRSFHPRSFQLYCMFD